MAHQHLGLSEIQGLAGLGELFDTLVVFENYPVDRGARMRRRAAVCGLPGSAVRMRRIIRCADGASGRAADICGSTYRGDLFDRADVEVMAARLIRLLEAAVAEPERAIGSLDILAADERETLLRGWNDTAHAIPAATLPELFAAQAAHAGGHRGGVRGRHA